MPQAADAGCGAGGLANDRFPVSPVAGPIVGRLLEIGVAVFDLPAATARLKRVFGASASRVIADPQFAMELQMCRVGDADFELMRSDGSGGLIDRFIARSGEGLHHVAFEVPDARAAMAAFRARGVPTLSDEPGRLDNLQAFFLPPRCLSGVLVEFIQNLHTWIDAQPLPPLGFHGSMALPPGQRVRVQGFGVQVADLESAAQSFASVLGGRNSSVFIDVDLQVRACYSRVANVEFKLMEPIGSDHTSPVLVARRSALQHVRLQADDPNAVVTNFRSEGVRVIDRAVSSGENPFPRFTDPASCNGMVFEILGAS